LRTEQDLGIPWAISDDGHIVKDPSRWWPRGNEFVIFFGWEELPDDYELIRSYVIRAVNAFDLMKQALEVREWVADPPDHAPPSLKPDGEGGYEHQGWCTCCRNWHDEGHTSDCLVFLALQIIRQVRND
jgi:hypothetical protein